MCRTPIERWGGEFLVLIRGWLRRRRLESIAMVLMDRADQVLSDAFEPSVDRAEQHRIVGHAGGGDRGVERTGGPQRNRGRITKSVAAGPTDCAGEHDERRVEDRD